MTLDASASPSTSEAVGAVEVNFDGLIGPTHHYAGLSEGNLASRQNRLAVSNPREAALQGLAKMKFLADLGLAQAVLPPHERPDLAWLRRLGFGGSDADVLQAVRKQAPTLLSAASSASAMWAANAAAVSPSADTADGRVHFTPANLAANVHRALEAPTTSRLLRAIFPDDSRFAHHEPLPTNAALGDEGAANHVRLSAAHGQPGIELFVYGRVGLERQPPTRFPARQTREASEAVARLHQLAPGGVVMLRQNPAAIDAGAFHNDVVAVGNENVLLYHADAFADAGEAKGQIESAFAAACGTAPTLLEISPEEVSLADAVRSYLFNSQLVTTPTGMALVCPTECREVESTRKCLDRLLRPPTPIAAVHFVDVRQSMHNGGGPACLRLRVVLTQAERAAAAPGVFLTDALHAALRDWVNRRYRDRLHPDDLADPLLPREGRDALDELTAILGLPAIYAFQQ